jgi:ElaB/YqjD/DUF883 family membrane-anchored ribosome-binding protein
MATKKTVRPSPSAQKGDSHPAEQDAGDSPRVRRAAETVRRAEVELEKAQQLYEKVRQEATDRLKTVREKSVGQLIDGTLATVRKHPGGGVIVAALIGFFVGKLFRR